MTLAHTSHFWLGCGAAAALVAGYFLPHHQAVRSEPHAPVAQATIPAQLLAGNGDAIGSSAPNVDPVGPSDGAMLVTPAAQSASTLKQIVVYVCGAVRKAGVYRFRPDMRVADGIARAGGAASDADLEQLNLAEPLSDGMKLAVPRKGELTISAAAPQRAGNSAASPPTRHHARAGRRSAGRSTQKLQPGQTLNVNTATEAQLMSLPGVGPSLARRIVEYRQANGPFQTADDLQNVSGIGASKFDKMADFIRL
ncbi:MAG: helix-hairpin-helix domain-containing protein [Candidatus Eremiobacter antarcticus]|nr:helix-hairpin-helix domain-containing protein [Candidatus Eremiobacteraeota bacterium]